MCRRSEFPTHLSECLPRSHYFQEIVTPDVLYEEVIEVEERLVLQQGRCQIKKQCPVLTGTTGEKVDPIVNIYVCQ